MGVSAMQQLLFNPPQHVPAPVERMLPGPQPFFRPVPGQMQQYDAIGDHRNSSGRDSRKSRKSAGAHQQVAEQQEEQANCISLV